jgi:uncharacterized protein
MSQEMAIVFFLTLFVRLWSTLAGGGGAVLIPALLYLGLPPDHAIATNRVSGSSIIFSIFKFHQQGQVKWRIGLFLALFAGMGAIIGSFLVLTLETSIMEKGIGLILLLSTPMHFLGKKVGMQERKVRMTKIHNSIGAAMMFVLGGVGGFLSATGIWFSYVFLIHYGFTYLQTAATRKLTGMAITSVSLAMFIPAGIIRWDLGISMFVGGAIGSWISAKYSQKLGNKWIRNMFLVVVVISAIRLLFF